MAEQNIDDGFDPDKASESCAALKAYLEYIQCIERTYEAVLGYLSLALESYERKNDG